MDRQVQAAGRFNLCPIPDHLDLFDSGRMQAGTCMKAEMQAGSTNASSSMFHSILLLSILGSVWSRTKDNTPKKLRPEGQAAAKSMDRLVQAAGRQVQPMFHPSCSIPFCSLLHRVPWRLWSRTKEITPEKLRPGGARRRRTCFATAAVDGLAASHVAHVMIDWPHLSQSQYSYIHSAPLYIEIF
jgi:hypothetical protein